MGWSPVFQRLQQETEFTLRLFVAQPDRLENSFLEISLVNPDASTPHLEAVENQVVSASANRQRRRFESLQILGIWRCEGVVTGHREAALFIFIEEREFRDPAELEGPWFQMAEAIRQFLAKK